MSDDKNYIDLILKEEDEETDDNETEIDYNDEEEEEEDDEEEYLSRRHIFSRPRLSARPNILLLPPVQPPEEKKAFGIPCPAESTTIPVEAKAIVLRCIACRENQIQTVNFPCMHACFCISCASQSLEHSNVCPQCRSINMHISMLYLCYGDATCNDLIHTAKKQKT